MRGEEPQNPVLVFGIGNSLRGDDEIGARILDLLRMRLVGEGVELITCNQLLPEHASEVSRATRVVFLDATTAGDPGTVTCASVLPCTPSEQFTHNLNPVMLLGAARDWFGYAPPAFLITVAGVDFLSPEELSPAVREAIPEVLQTIESLLPQATSKR